MDNNIKIILEDSSAADYYELESIFNSGNIKASIITQDTTGVEMGFGFNELVVLLPLLVPYVIQFRKILVAYFEYKKPLGKNKSLTLECNGKKLKIESENDSIPDVDELMSFFSEREDSDEC